MFGDEPKTTVYAKFVHPDNGYDHHIESAKQLKLNEYYEVSKISMSQSSTGIYLKDYPKNQFTSVQFEFYDHNKKSINIYEMPEFNHYMRRASE